MFALSNLFPGTYWKSIKTMSKLVEEEIQGITMFRVETNNTSASYLEKFNERSFFFELMHLSRYWYRTMNFFPFRVANILLG